MRSETFHTPGSVQLTIKLPRGEVELATVDATETVVELSPLGDPERAERQIERSQITLVERGDYHEVVVDADPDDFGFKAGGVTLSISGRRAPLRLRVRAPHGSNVNVSTASADIAAHGRFGEVNAQSASGDVDFGEVERDATFKLAAGDVRVRRVGGSLTLKTAAGDVEAGPVDGDAEVRTASGDVELAEVKGSVSVHSASGDVRVGAVTQGRVEVKSLSGDVEVGVRRGSRVWMDVKTLTGDARSELDVGEASDADDDEEGPLVELLANAMSGDIRIVRA